MKKYVRIYLAIMILLMQSLFIPVQIKAENALTLNWKYTSKKEADIEKLIAKCLKEGKIPGASVVIVHGDKTICQKNYGYADVKKKEKVTEDTLFEIGSTTKAFTGLAVLKLAEEGKLNLDSKVSEYIPWFQMKYKGVYHNKKIDEAVDISVEQLLHHTSGMKTEWLGDIKAGSSDNDLEDMVKSLNGKYLANYPGEVYGYSSVNYDVLGLLIQTVTGQTYESYIKEELLWPLGLHNSYMTREEASSKGMAKGYKMGFLEPREYHASEYRANAPSGYLISNSKDMEKWLKIQLQTYDEGNFPMKLIDISHQANRTVSPCEDGASYAAGWYVYQRKNGVYVHGGNNPNYSSHILFREGEKLGVCVLTNIASSYTDNMAEGIMSILCENARPPMDADSNKILDIGATIVFAVSILFSLIILINITWIFMQVARGERRVTAFSRKDFVSYVAFLLLMALILYCLYLIPNIMYADVPWDFVKVWGPFSLIPAIIAFYTVSFLFGLYYLIRTKCTKEKDKPIFPIVVLSCISGLANAIIIFTINNAVYQIRHVNKGIIVLFILGLILYIEGQKIIKSKLIVYTNDIIYEKRVMLTDCLMKTSLDKIEVFGRDKVCACLNNDTEVISYMPGIIIGIITDGITLACCLLYLGALNIYGMLLSVLVIGFSAVLYFVISKTANGLLEKARESQNTFFEFIQDLVDGFKELKMNEIKNAQFKKDMNGVFQEYNKSRSDASIRFVNVEVIGDMLFTIVIAVEAFFFPYLFKEINAEELTSYILIFLYIAAPVRGILAGIPQLFSINVSWKRINSFIEQLKNMDEHVDETSLTLDEGKEISLRFENITYQYESDADGFCLKETTLDLHSGEIVFITGGNGSGKSTLAKVITGLYVPKSGQIILNGQPVTSKQLRGLYTQVFSDFHLFKKLYGVDCEEKETEIHELLSMLQLQDKVTIENNCFSTIELSTGQKKRLAFLSSYLEDKQIYLFDEWAADQDPEYRRYFYENILPDLKKRGKCVVAISHDDRYFHLADKVVKMEFGGIEKIVANDNSVIEEAN